MLRVTCPSCQAVLSVRPEGGSRAVRCPACKWVFTVAIPSPEPTQADWRNPPPVRPTVAVDESPEPEPEPEAAPGYDDDPLPSPRSHRNVILAIVLVVLIAGIGLAIPAVSDIMAKHPNAKPLIGLAFAAVFGIVGIAFAVYWLAGRSSQCPVCRRGWARRVIDTELVEEKKCYGLVTRHSHTWGGGSYSGTSHTFGSTRWTDHSGTTSHSSSTSWQERVPVIRRTYQLSCLCKYCGHEWEEIAARQVEDFDRR